VVEKFKRTDPCKGYKELKLRLEESLKGSWFVPGSFEKKLADYCEDCKNK